MVKATDERSIHRKRKAITTYAVWWYRDGQQGLLDILFRLFRVPWEHRKPWGPDLFLRSQPAFIWCHIEPLVATALSEESLVSLKHDMLLASPYLPWKQFKNHTHLIQLWAAVASIVPYTNDIGQSVVDTLLQIADDPSLQPHMPADMWSWLKKRPSLPPVCSGCIHGSTRRVVRVVRALGDIEILQSYLLLIWSEWNNPQWDAVKEMCASLQEDFSGIGMGNYRQDLLRRLDYVLGQLDLGPEHIHPAFDTLIVRRMKEKYRMLREMLLRVGRKAGLP